MSPAAKSLPAWSAKEKKDFLLFYRIPEISQSVAREIPCGTSQKGGAQSVPSGLLTASGKIRRKSCAKRMRLFNHHRASGHANKYW